MVSLSLYYTSTASTTTGLTTTAAHFAAGTGGSQSNGTWGTRPGGAYYAELRKATGANLTASLPANPSGYGQVFDATTLEGQRLAAGTWTATMYFAYTGNPWTGRLWFQVWKRSSGGVYTYIGDGGGSSDVATTASYVAYTGTLTTSGVTDFAVGDKLYIEFYFKASTRPSTSPTLLWYLSTTTSGVATAQIVTPGYTPSPVTSTRTITGVRASVGGVSGLFAADTFAGRSVAAGGWGTASDGHVWQVIDGTASGFSVDANEGNAALAAGWARISLGTEGTRDVDISARFALGSATDNFGLEVRRDPTVQTCYQVEVTATSFYVHAYVNAVQVTNPIMLESLTFTPGTFYWVRLRVIGSNIFARYWIDGTQEPATWAGTNTDTNITANGRVAVFVHVGTGTNLLVDSFESVALFPGSCSILHVSASVAPPSVTTYTRSLASLSASVQALDIKRPITGVSSAVQALNILRPISSVSAAVGAPPTTVSIPGVKARDTFAGRTVSGSYGTASDGESYTITNNFGEVVSVASGRGTVFYDGVHANGFADYAVQFGTATYAHPDVRLCVRAGTSDSFCVLYTRDNAGGAGNDIGASVAFSGSNSSVRVFYRVGYSSTTIQSRARNITMGQDYWIRFCCVDQNIQLKVWKDGEAEPDVWDISVSDSHVSGAGGLIVELGTAGTSSGAGMSLHDLTISGMLLPTASVQYPSTTRFISPVSASLAYHAAGLNYGHQSTYDTGQVESDLTFLFSQGIRRLRLAGVPFDSSAGVANMQDCVTRALSHGFFVTWGVINGWGPGTITATRWTSFRAYVTGTLVPWAISVGLPELSIGNEEEAKVDGTTITAETYRANLRALAADIHAGTYGAYSGHISYACEGYATMVDAWADEGIGDLDFISFNVYGTLSFVGTESASLAAIFGGRTYISEFGSLGSGSSDFVSEQAYYDYTYAALVTMRDHGIREGYFFCYRDGGVGVPANSFGLLRTNDDLHPAFNALMGGPARVIAPISASVLASVPRSLSGVSAALKALGVARPIVGISSATKALGLTRACVSVSASLVFTGSRPIVGASAALLASQIARPVSPLSTSLLFTGSRSIIGVSGATKAFGVERGVIGVSGSVGASGISRSIIGVGAALQALGVPRPISGVSAATLQSGIAKNITGVSASASVAYSRTITGVSVATLQPGITRTLVGISTSLSMNYSRSIAGVSSAVQAFGVARSISGISTAVGVAGLARSIIGVSVATKQLGITRDLTSISIATIQIGITRPVVNVSASVVLTRTRSVVSISSALKALGVERPLSGVSTATKALGVSRSLIGITGSVGQGGITRTIINVSVALQALGVARNATSVSSALQAIGVSRAVVGISGAVKQIGITRDITGVSITLVQTVSRTVIGVTSAVQALSVSRSLINVSSSLTVRTSKTVIGVTGAVKALGVARPITGILGAIGVAGITKTVTGVSASVFFEGMVYTYITVVGTRGNITPLGTRGNITVEGSRGTITVQED